MQIGNITIDGRVVGTVTLDDGPTPAAAFRPILASFEGDGGSEPVPGDGPMAGHHGVDFGRENQHSQGRQTGPDSDAVKGAYPEVNIRAPAESGGHKVYGRLADARDRARQELKDKPWLNEKAMHIFAGENPDPTASTALWESAINRAAVRGTSLEKELRRTSEGGYYEGWRDNVSPETRKVLEASRDRALDHSNVSDYATDNSSGGLAERDNARGWSQRNVLNREHFFGPDLSIPSHQKAWHDLVKESETKRTVSGDAASAASEPAIGGETPRGYANLMHGQYGQPGENLTRVTTPSGMTATVHKDAAASFQGFLSDLEKSGYKIKSLGGYADRNKVGASGLSQHAYGNAIDINPEQNPQHGGTNLPSNVSDMAAKWGLSWGGDWSRRFRDPMHFEWTGHRPWENVAKQSPTSPVKTADADKTYDPETMAP